MSNIPRRFLFVGLTQLALLAVFALDFWSAGGRQFGPIDAWFGLSYARVDGGEVWRFATAPLLNSNPGPLGEAGQAHLLINSATLWVFGSEWGRAGGYVRWPLVAILAGMTSYVIAYLARIPSPFEFFGGSSSITWGLMGAVLAGAFFRETRGVRLLFILLFALTMILWNVTQALHGGVSSAHIVHASALIIGSTIGAACSHTLRTQSQAEEDRCDSREGLRGDSEI